MWKLLKNKKGFSLIEILIAVTLLAILTALVAPRITAFMSNKEDEVKLFLTYITKTFDDAFLNDRVNFLIIHLNEPDQESVYDNKLFERTNGLSVATLEGSKFIETKRKILKHRSFNSDFIIEKVLFPHKEKVVSGYALIPFHPHGFSENAIIHLLIKNEIRMSIKIDKHLKEPIVKKEFIEYDSDETK